MSNFTGGKARFLVCAEKKMNRRGRGRNCRVQWPVVDMGGHLPLRVMSHMLTEARVVVS